MSLPLLAGCCLLLAGGGDEAPMMAQQGSSSPTIVEDNGTKAILSMNGDKIDEREEKGRAFRASVAHRHRGR